VILGAAGLAAAALICLDPGHGTPVAVGRQVEPIGPGSKVMKIKDGGGASGEAGVALAVARRTRSLLLARGYRVAMTRTGPTFRYGNGGNIARAQFCNRRHAALMVRIHADGSQNTSLHGYLPLIALSAKWEQAFAESLIGTGDERSLAMQPSRLSEFMMAVRDRFEQAARDGEAPVLVTSAAIRPFVRSLIERFRSQTSVLSQAEIHPRARLKTVGSI